ncbi:MAG TPA: Hint domain-containing protein, partial [Rhodopila sp.]
LGTYNGSTFGTETVPNGAGGVPLAVVSVPTTSWEAAANPITVTAGATVTYHTGGSPVTLDPGLTLTDSASTTLTSAAVAIDTADFVPGDTLNFTDQNGITGSFNANNGELTLTGTATKATYQAALESVTYSFSPTGGYSGDGDSTNDGANFSRTISWAVSDGTNNSLAATSSLATLCFCEGTMIATPTGEVEVEKLVAGDMVLTANGVARPIAWVGTGRVLATRGRRGPATPVIVRKGALADNVPHTDLRVTKGHAMLLDGVLIAVEFLINHRSILWDDHAQEVSLRHIELETHDVLLANGAPAESYRDDGNRWLFQNANTGWDLPPQEPCAPVLTGGEIVDRVWRRLLDLSGPRDLPPLTDDPDLHLLVDGQRVDASKRVGRLASFRLPKGAGQVHVISRDAVAAELGIARDFRSLGVALRWIEVSQASKVTLIEADDDRLVDGFHLYETDGNLRWTNGDALLPAELLSGFSGAVDVVLAIAATMQYPLLQTERAAA